VLSGAKQTASRSTCQSNLSQIGKAFESYLSDYGGRYPNNNDPYLWMGRHWRWPMNKYLFWGVYNASDSAGANQITHRGNTILACPSDPSPVDMYDKTSYGYSAAFYHLPGDINKMTLTQLYSPANPGPACVSVDSSMLKYPAKKAMVAEWLSVHSETSVTWWSLAGSRSFLFADGHVKYLTDRSIHPAVDDYPDINLTKDGISGMDVD